MSSTDALNWLHSHRWSFKLTALRGYNESVNFSIIVLWISLKQMMDVCIEIVDGSSDFPHSFYHFSTKSSLLSVACSKWI